MDSMDLHALDGTSDSYFLADDVFPSLTDLDELSADETLRTNESEGLLPSRHSRLQRRLRDHPERFDDDGLSTSDTVRLYLQEIGETALLTPKRKSGSLSESNEARSPKLGSSGETTSRKTNDWPSSLTRKMVNVPALI